MRWAAAVVLGMWLASGCTLMQDMSPRYRLRKAARELNDRLRWSPQAMASPRIAASYRARFVDSRRHWGDRIRIAEAEVVAIQWSRAARGTGGARSVDGGATDRGDAGVADGADAGTEAKQGARASLDDDETGDLGVAVVTYRWYSKSTLSVYQTTVRQTWKSVSGGFVLVGERVVGGDPRLLSPPSESSA